MMMCKLSRPVSELNYPDNFCSDLLLALFPVIEKDVALAKYLNDNPIQRDSGMVPAPKRKKILLSIQLYVKVIANSNFAIERAVTSYSDVRHATLVPIKMDLSMKILLLHRIITRDMTRRIPC